MVVQNPLRVVFVQRAADFVDRNGKVAPATGDAPFLHKSLFGKALNQLCEMTSRYAETVCDGRHVLTAFLVLQKILEHLDLRIGIRNIPLMQFLYTVNVRVNVAVVDQRFHDAAVFSHPFQFHGKFSFFQSFYLFQYTKSKEFPQDM